MTTAVRKAFILNGYKNRGVEIMERDALLHGFLCRNILCFLYRVGYEFSCLADIMQDSADK